MKKFSARFFLFLTIMFGFATAVYIAAKLNLDFSDINLEDDFL